MHMISDCKSMRDCISSDTIWFQYDLLRCKDGLNSVCFVPFGCILDDSKLGRTRRAVGRQIDGSSSGHCDRFDSRPDNGIQLLRESACAGPWHDAMVNSTSCLSCAGSSHVVDVIWVTCPFEYCPVGPVRPGLCGRCFNQRPQYQTQTLWGRFESFVHFGNRLELRY